MTSGFFSLLIPQVSCAHCKLGFNNTGGLNEYFCIKAVQPVHCILRLTQILFLKNLTGVLCLFYILQDPQTIRTLTLISKTIQTLGSWGSLSKSKVSLYIFCFVFTLLNVVIPYDPFSLTPFQIKNKAKPKICIYRCSSHLLDSRCVLVTC